MLSESESSHNSNINERGRKSNPETVLLSSSLEKISLVPEVSSNTLNPYMFIEKYRAKGINLEAEFSKRSKTLKRGQISERFLTNHESSVESRLMEVLPLVANIDGILGDYVHARISKTAKLDDSGNDFVDLVVELKNDYVKVGGAEEVRPSVTFCIDVTVNNELTRHKKDILNRFLLSQGRKANVLCYENKHGVLGVDASKVIVFMSKRDLVSFAQGINGSVSVDGGKFSIKDKEAFFKWYRVYFGRFLSTIKDNALENMHRLKLPTNGQEFEEKREDLWHTYQDIVRFVDAYQKTPTEKI